MKKIKRLNRYQKGILIFMMAMIPVFTVLYFMESAVVWSEWFCAVFVSVLNALSILFADELFRLDLIFQIRDVEHVEPSDWEIAKRYIIWTVLPIMALILFIIGLQ